QPAELVDLKARAARIGEPGKQHAALNERNRRSVARSRAEHVVGGRHAAGGRHVLNDDRGIAGDMPAEMSRDQARLMVVSTSYTGAHDERHLLARVEILRHRREQAGASDRQDSQRKDKSSTRSNDVHHGLAGVGPYPPRRLFFRNTRSPFKKYPMPATISHHFVGTVPWHGAFRL